MINKKIVKSFAALVLMLLMGIQTIAQEKNNIEKFEGMPHDEQEGVYNASELIKSAEYTDGGLKGFYNYVNKHFKIPKIKKNMTARIYISYIIEKDGSMSNIKILRDPGYGLGDEAMRVLKNMNKKWIPGINAEGETVRSNYTLPITINITN